MIFELSLARADATPPAETVPVAKLTLMMSHRMWWLPAEALKLGEGPAFAASTVEAGVPLSHPRAMPISATPARPALKVRAFIMCSSFCVFLLLRPVTLCQRRCSGAEVAHGPCTGGNTFAIESELGEWREPTRVWSQQKGSLHDALLSRLKTSQRRLPRHRGCKIGTRALGGSGGGASGARISQSGRGLRARV